MLHRGDMHAEWLAYGSDTKRAATAFVEGINAFVELTRSNPDLLPVEFRELGYEPALWDPEDVARIRSHGLFYNLREEVARAQTVRDFGAEVEDLRRTREPARDLHVPEGLDLTMIPDDVLAVYDLATTPPAFGPLDPEAAQGKVLPEGSNNWVLAGQRTASGRPLLANDPHRAAAALPGLRYLSHLSAPGFDVIGGGEPGLPGISIGHNGQIAFGLTIFAIDQEDLYVYELTCSRRPSRRAPLATSSRIPAPQAFLIGCEPCSEMDPTSIRGSPTRHSCRRWAPRPLRPSASASWRSCVTLQMAWTTTRLPSECTSACTW